MAELISVPTYNFSQGDDLIESEALIQMQFYRGTVCLEQEGNEIIIADEMIDTFCKQLKKLRKDADILLK